MDWLIQHWRFFRGWQYVICVLICLTPLSQCGRKGVVMESDSGTETGVLGVSFERGQDHRALFYVRPRNNNSYSYFREAFEDDSGFERKVWVGWGSKASQASILLCSGYSQPQIHRVSLGDFKQNLNSDFTESDRNLFISLESAFAGEIKQHPPWTSGVEGLSEWFCNGFGNEAFASKFPAIKEHVTLPGGYPSKPPVTLLPMPKR